MRKVLTAVGRGDECAIKAGSGKNDIPGLVAYQQRAHHLCRTGREIDDTHAIRKMINHPYLIVVARRDGNWFHAHRDGVDKHQRSGVDREHFEAIIRSVDRQQPGAIWCERDGPDLAALEGNEGGLSQH